MYLGNTMLKNFKFRYLYEIAATWNTKHGFVARNLLMTPQFLIHLVLFGLILTVIHGLSTLFLSPDQFFIEQGG